MLLCALQRNELNIIIIIKVVKFIQPSNAQGHYSIDCAGTT
jgi:hypothetical protein